MKKLEHHLTENVKVLQKAVLIHDGRCLIMKRSDASQSRPGKWDLPGGNVEWPTATRDLQNPHLDELLREIVEETGVILNEDTVESCYVGTYYKADQDMFTVILGWKVELSQIPEVKLSKEHTEYAWMALEEGSEYDFGFAGEKGQFIRTMIDNSLSDEGCCGGCGGHGGEC